MKKKVFLILLGLILLQCSISIAMQPQNPAPVRVGDFLLTKQPPHGSHAGVVVWAPADATVDSLDDVVLADHAPRKKGHGRDGVRLTRLREFKIAGVFHSSAIPENEKSETFLIIARAIAAFVTNAEYDIALKNCGGFAEWCINGSLSGFSDFRMANSRSFNRENREYRKFCDGTAEGMQDLIKSIQEDKHISEDAKRENIAMIEGFTEKGLWYLGNHCPEGEANYVRLIKLKTKDTNFAVNASDPKGIPPLADILFAALLLDKGCLGLTNIAWAKLIGMSDAEAAYLCSRIVDEDVLGHVVDVGLLIENMRFATPMDITSAKL